MRILIVDNSNTRTKFALADGDQLDPWRAIIATPEISPKSLEECLADINWDASIISSVVPQKAPADDCKRTEWNEIDSRKAAPKEGDRRGESTQAHADDCKEVQASAGDGASAQRAGGAQASNHPSYQGGVIAPGLASMTEGLANRTALLPHITLQEPECAIGKSTEQAMLAGAVYGYRGLVREILHNLNQEFSNDPLVIATGGDAPLITRGLDEITHLAPDLTLEGLKIIAHLNISYP